MNLVHETLNSIKSDIQTLLTINEFQYKSIRIAHYREASYFAFEGSYVYLIIDCPLSGSPEFCYVGETSNLGPILRAYARNHRFSHAFVIDMGESDKSVRELVKIMLIKKFNTNNIVQKRQLQKYLKEMKSTL